MGSPDGDGGAGGGPAPMAGREALDDIMGEGPASEVGGGKEAEATTTMATPQGTGARGRGLLIAGDGATPGSDEAGDDKKRRLDEAERELWKTIDSALAKYVGDVKRINREMPGGVDHYSPDGKMSKSVQKLKSSLMAQAKKK